MSLDGFIADTNDQVGPLFHWYNNGTQSAGAQLPGLEARSQRSRFCDKVPT
jgi:hypothetical protein